MKKNRRELDRRNFLKTSGFLTAMGGFSGVAASSWLNGNRADGEESEPTESQAPKFVAAKPVWAEGREKEMNVFLLFSSLISVPTTAGVILRATGSTVLKINVNGEDIGYGPARGPHGWFRVDEWNLTPHLKNGQNFIVISVAGYNSNSYYLLDQPSFLQAEIVDGAGNVLAATSPEKNTIQPEIGTAEKPASFACSDARRRLQKVQRFSFQRPFIEVYDWNIPNEIPKLAEQPEVRYLPRRVPYPELTKIDPVAWGKTGKATRRETLENPWRDRSLVNIGPALKGYKLEELDVVLSDEIQRLETTFDDAAPALGVGAEYKAGDVQIVDFGANYCGFYNLEFDEVAPKTKIAVTFDEILNDQGDVNFLRLGTCSAIEWTFRGGEKGVSAFEPQVGRYAKIDCLEGSFKLARFYLTEYAYPPTREASFDCSDPRLMKLYRAAVLTFRENSVDIPMDCPSRERAGWLCDSFFTCRTAFDLTGRTDVEQSFFENYQLPEKFEFLPDGILPMCYPADHNDGVYIPNWAMWFVVQLEEYARRTPDRSTIAALKTKVEKLLNFFTGYENSDGLLEKLPSWVFVEWSAANQFVQDVNYPSNMLYAATLDAAGRLYDVPAWREKAKKIRAEIVRQAFDGEFFVDHAIRKPDGTLDVKRDRTEVCQYFAFFFKTATPESHPDLWKKLLDQFGPNRVKEGIFPEVHQANSFVGNVVRLELLAMAGRGEQLLDESVAYNEYMADRTGTLWENDGAYASCDHGFASHIAHVFYRDILGVYEVNAAERKLTIRLPKIDYLQWAGGVRPVPGGVVRLRWEKKDGRLVYQLSTPENYEVNFENASGLEVVRTDE